MTTMPILQPQQRRKSSSSSSSWCARQYVLVMMATAMLLSIPARVALADRLPFTVGVRDSLMIAHSFHNRPAFGPAGGMHGATYTCDVEFCSSSLVPDVNWVLDMGHASAIVSDVLQTYHLKNLDDMFPSEIATTTEFMARTIHKDIVQKVRDEILNFEGIVRVKLWESHRAWASYEGTV